MNRQIDIRCYHRTKDWPEDHDKGFPGQTKGENNILHQNENKGNGAKNNAQCLRKHHRFLRANNKKEGEEDNDYQNDVSERPGDFGHEIFLDNRKHICDGHEDKK